MSTDSKQIPTVTISTLLENGAAAFAELEGAGVHTNLGVVTDSNGEAQAAVGNSLPGAFIVESGGNKTKYPFVSKEKVSTYSLPTGQVAGEIPVEKKPDLQQPVVLGLMQSADGSRLSLHSEQTIQFNQTDACSAEPWEINPQPTSIAVLDAETRTTLGHLTYPPLPEGQTAVLKGHRIIRATDGQYYTINARVTGEPKSILKPYGSYSWQQANSQITVNAMTDDLLSGKETLIDAPQLSLKNFAVFEMTVFKADNGHWDLAVMGYAIGTDRPQILLINDVLTLRGSIDLTQPNANVSVVNVPQTANEGVLNNRLAQARFDGRSYVVFAMQEQFYCEAKRPVWLIDVEELKAKGAPLTLGDETAGVTQIVFYSSNANDCFGWHAVTIKDNEGDSLALPANHNSKSREYVDNTYVLRDLPADIQRGTVTELDITQTAEFVITNNDDDENICSDMGLGIKTGSVATENPMLVQLCSNSPNEGGHRTFITDVKKAKELALTNGTNTTAEEVELEVDDSGLTDETDMDVRELARQNEEKQVNMGAQLMAFAAAGGSFLAPIATALLGTEPRSNAIGMESPIQEIQCDAPEEPNSFSVAIVALTVTAVVAAVSAVGFFGYRALQRRDVASDTENPAPGNPTASTPLINQN